MATGDDATARGDAAFIETGDAMNSVALDVSAFACKSDIGSIEIALAFDCESVGEETAFARAFDCD